MRPNPTLTYRFCICNKPEFKPAWVLKRTLIGPCNVRTQTDLRQHLLRNRVDPIRIPKHALLVCTLTQSPFFGSSLWTPFGLDQSKNSTVVIIKAMSILCPKLGAEWIGQTWDPPNSLHSKPRTEYIPRLVKWRWWDITACDKVV